MRYLLILLLFACSEKEEIMIEEEEPLSEACQNLLDDDYDEVIHSKDQIRCIFILTDTSYTFHDCWSLYELARYEDGRVCGDGTEWIGLFEVISDKTTRNGIEYTCDC